MSAAVARSETHRVSARKLGEIGAASTRRASIATATSTTTRSCDGVLGEKETGTAPNVSAAVVRSATNGSQSDVISEVGAPTSDVGHAKTGLPSDARRYVTKYAAQGPHTSVLDRARHATTPARAAISAHALRQPLPAGYSVWSHRRGHISLVASLFSESKLNVEYHRRHRRGHIGLVASLFSESKLNVECHRRHWRGHISLVASLFS